MTARTTTWLCLLAVVLAAGGARAGERVVLRSGFAMSVDRHEVDGEVVRLHTATGSMEVPRSEVATIEVEENAPRVKPAPGTVNAPVAAPVERVATPRELVEQAAERHGLRPEFLRSVAAAESAFQPAAVSPKGAIGVMQLMPGTAQALGVSNPRDPVQNIEAGTRYLKSLLERYKNHPDFVRLALAAYNAGPGAVDKYRDIPPYRETQVYVEKIVREYTKQLPNAGGAR